MKKLVVVLAVLIVILGGVLTYVIIDKNKEKAENGSDKPASIAETEPQYSLTLDDIIVEEKHDLKQYNGKDAAEATYFGLSLSDEAAKAYPGLAERIDALSQGYIETVEADYDDAYDSAVEALNYSDSIYGPYSVCMTAKPFYADSNAVSIFYTCSLYLGGIHPSYIVLSDNIDARTGKDLELSDVFNDLEAAKQVFAEELFEQAGIGFYDSADSASAYDYIETVVGDGSDVSLIWAINGEGITIRVNPYDLGPYAAGVLEASVSYSEHPDIFNQSGDGSLIDIFQ